MYSKLANNPAFEDELRLLFNALRVESFKLILISHNHPSIYPEIRSALSEHFGRSRKIHEFSFRNMTPSDTRNAVIRLDKGILLMRDVEYLFRDAHNSLCTYFNQRRDFFAKHDIAFLFFIEPGSFKRIAQKMPDWWSLRSLELEFSIPLDKDSGMALEWSKRGSSPYANWTQEERNAEIARLERLIGNTDPEDFKLLGWLYFDLGEVFVCSNNTGKAIENYTKCLALFKDIGDREGEGDTLNNLAITAYARGDYDRALGYLEQSLAIQQAIGDRKGEGTTLNNISQIYDARGDYDRALGYLEQSLAIQQAIGDRKGEGTTLNNISQIYDAKGDYDRALGYLEQSLAIQRAIGDRKGEGATLNNISQIHKVRGDHDRALGYLEQSLALGQAIDDRRGEGTTLNNISQIYDAKGDYDRALGYLEQSLAIQQAIGDISGLATTLNNMAAIYLQQKNDMVRAVHLFYQAYRILEQLGSPDIQYPTSYLQAIIGQIGEEKFKEIIADISREGQ
ncbi:MAG: tetratricopeptide repeat protein [Saprospiraceae bacterium]